jgi:hypothetical protein
MFPKRETPHVIAIVLQLGYSLKFYRWITGPLRNFEVNNMRKVYYSPDGNGQW